MTALMAVFGMGVLAAPRIFAAEPQAEAQILNRQGRNIGTARFSKADAGVKVQVSLKGLEPGIYALHIHDKDVCSAPDFSSAGEHFNPSGRKHGFLNSEGPHAGDLPNVTVGEDGTVEEEFVTGLLSLEKGEDASLVGDTQTSILIHSQPDDYITDPAGGAGDRIACGPIVAVKPEEQ